MPGEPTGMPGTASPVAFRLLPEKAFERGGRNVPFDHVTRDLRGVAGGEIVRNGRAGVFTASMSLVSMTVVTKPDL